jgi:glutathione S-transferase
VRYLARKHGLGSLCPADPKTCADADRWMDWDLSVLTPNVRVVFWNLVRIPPEKRDMGAVAESRNKLAASLAILDARLAGRRYVTGDTFTMGDIPVGTSIQRWFNVPIEREPLPNLEAYYRRLQERPAFRQYADILPLT